MNIVSKPPTNIKAVFEEASRHLKITPGFLKLIHQTGQAFVNKTEDHVRFFGGNLTGVHIVRFTSADKNDWISEGLEYSEYDIRKAITSLPTVDASWVRATDIINLSSLYLAHAIFKSNLSPKQKEEGMIDILLLMHYKLISSLMAHYFKYPADEQTAVATYAALSKKYALKVHGTWGAVLRERCRDIISTNSIHYKTLERFDDDDAIVYMITDIQGRLRNMVKNLYVVFEMVRTQNAKILTVGGTVELDGKMVVRDISNNYTPYRRYLSEIVLDTPRFVKPELIEIITSVMSTMSEAMLTGSLNYISEQAKENNKVVNEFLDEILLHAFEYLSTDSRAREKFKDIPALISRLRGLYMASRSSDPALLKLRNTGEKLIRKAVQSKNPSMLAAVRTGVLLYVVLRTFSKDHYG